MLTNCNMSLWIRRRRVRIMRQLAKNPINVRWSLTTEGLENPELDWPVSEKLVTAEKYLC